MSTKIDFVMFAYIYLCMYISVYHLFQAISSMEDKGMRDDPRYAQLMAMASRAKGNMGPGQGMQGPPGPGQGPAMDMQDQGHPGTGNSLMGIGILFEDNL